MSRQSQIRRELVEAEAQANYWGRRTREDGSSDQLYYRAESYQHFMGRRRFFLKELLKAQLKEFNHD